ncbi:MAG: AAA family ATPase [Chloroflexi bacterium]|nr:AAA family ATPase [Chloroflexota bacterium]
MELNRRLSPAVYLGVVSIVPNAVGGFRVSRTADDPAAVEYAVEMVRLPQSGMLDERLRLGNATPQMLRSLGGQIASFHRIAATSPEISATGDLDGVRFNVEENFSQTEPYVGRTIDRAVFDRIASYSRSFLTRRAALFHARARNGYIRDAHGDLRAAQVHIDDDGHVSVLDCIEFNERFRWGDTALDVAFLTMDLEALGHPALAGEFLDGYLAEADDAGLPELLPFYQCYRAYVRGKVEGFRLDQPGVDATETKEISERASAFFALADGYARTAVGPHLLLVGGLMGTGKTTVAQGVAGSRGLAYLSSDLVRKELAGIKPDDRRYEAFDAGMYGRDSTERTYDELAARASRYLEDGRSVVVDASFRREGDRARLVNVARRLSPQPTVVTILCEAEDAIVKARLERRQESGTGPSDGRWELYEQQRVAFEFPKNQPDYRVVRLDTSGSPELLVAQVVASMDDERLQ